MMRYFGTLGLALLLPILISPPSAKGETSPTNGIALVIGNAAQAALPIADADKDAGLIADALARRGYKVFGARNLDQDVLRATIEDFKQQMKTAGTAPVFIYFAGAFFQHEADNFFLPSDTSGTAKAKAISMKDLTDELSRISSGPKILVMDGARLPIDVSLSTNIPSGFALPNVHPNFVISMNQVPGITTFASGTDLSAFAQAWADAISAGASSTQGLTDLVTLRTFELSQGQQVPWMMGQHDPALKLFAPSNTQKVISTTLHTRPMNQLGMDEAFASALLKNSIPSYEEYILIYIQNPMTRISRSILAAMRESYIWKEVTSASNAGSFWAYLNLYPNGPHATEAHTALQKLNKPIIAPANEAVMAITSWPPAADEITLLNQTRPYRIDPAIHDLKPAVASIAALLSPYDATKANAQKSAQAETLFALPLPTNDASINANIVLPAPVPKRPIIEVKAPAAPKKTAQPKIPLPPQRGQEQEPQAPKEEPALITITIPVMTSQPAEAPAPAPAKAKQIKPITDFFEKPFGTSPEEQNLPY